MAETADFRGSKRWRQAGLEPLEPCNLLPGPRQRRAMGRPIQARTDLTQNPFPGCSRVSSAFRSRKIVLPSESPLCSDCRTWTKPKPAIIPVRRFHFTATVSLLDFLDQVLVHLKIKALLLSAIAGTLLLTGCVNPYAQFYRNYTNQ